ncbi:MAG TPA: hypothetical protein VHC39_16485 [Rhizomicrobium sp.]|nr:hypothetical protein [Rhizomicrobium sp.]
MSQILHATTAFALAALLTGHLQLLSPRWRAVAVDLHQAHPQAKLEMAILSLLPGRKG